MINDKHSNDKNHELSTMKLAVFQGREIRKIIHGNEWHFSIVDVIEILTDSPEPASYWSKVKNDDSELRRNWTKLKLESKDGKKRDTECANTEDIFRIIQSIPSKKAEPFKRWLAKVGYERIQEIEDPELGVKRARVLYKAKGRSENWVEKRMRGINIREELTDEWKTRGIIRGKEYAILTSEISKAAFGMTPADYRKYKGLDKENLRDHMTDLELIFSMLGEASTKEIAIQRDVQGFSQNLQAAQDGGAVANNAIKDLQEKSGKQVITSTNFLPSENKQIESDN